MHNRPFYHDASRQLQDRFDTRRLANRLEQVLVHSVFTEEDRRFVENCCMFFLATADAEGCPDCSYKAGVPGFVRVVDDRTLAFPSYDGNGMYRSLGNILVNPHVGILFIDFEQGKRVRVNGVAEILNNDPLLQQFPSSQLVVRVKAEQIFANCPRYIHKMRLLEYSAYAPREGYKPPAAEWKKSKTYLDYLPAGDPAGKK